MTCSILLCDPFPIPRLIVYTHPCSGLPVLTCIFSSNSLTSPFSSIYLILRLLIFDSSERLYFNLFAVVHFHISYATVKLWKCLEMIRCQNFLSIKSYFFFLSFFLNKFFKVAVMVFHHPCTGPRCTFALIYCRFPGSIPSPFQLTS